jgi:hypothetical protein
MSSYKMVHEGQITDAITIAAVYKVKVDARGRIAL